MTIGRIKSFPYPERVDSIEGIGEHLRRLHRSLTEDQYEKITDIENMVLGSLEVTDLTVVTSFKPTVDDTVDIGATTLRFQDLWLSGSLKDDTVTLTVAHAKDAYDKRVDTWGDGLQISSNTASVDYNTGNLKITSTELNTIQDIDTDADVTFDTLTLSDGASSYADIVMSDDVVNTGITITGYTGGSTPNFGLAFPAGYGGYLTLYADGTNLSPSAWLYADYTNSRVTLGASTRIRIKPNNTDTDYIEFSVQTGIPIIESFGGDDLTIISDSGTIDFSNEILKTTGGITLVTAIDEFSTDGTMGDNSDSVVPTEAAIVTYVAAQITAEDLDYAGDAGTGAVDLDSQIFTLAGTDPIDTAASNQTLTISHKNTSGYIHVPASGSSAQILQYSAAGTAKWATVSSHATIADGGAITIDHGGINGLADDDHTHYSFRNKGIMSGCVVSDATGTDVNWTAGYIYDYENTTVRTISSASTQGVSNNSVNFVYFDPGTSTTVLQISTTRPTDDDQVLVATVCAQDADIVGILNEDIIGKRIGEHELSLHEMFPIWVTSGGSISAYTDDATSDLDVVMDALVFVAGGHHRYTSGSLNSEDNIMTTHFHDASNNWDSGTANDVDTANYDDIDDSAGIINIPSNKWVKGMFYFSLGAINYIYPTEYFTNEAQALIASPPATPPGLERCVPLTVIVFQQGETDISDATFIDIRPGLDEISQGVVSAHGTLSGLASDDHTQYILHSLADAANDFIVASGADVYIKKTLADTGALLEGDMVHDNLVSSHAAATTVQDADFASNGILKRTSAGVYGIVTDNSATWDGLVSCTFANVDTALAAANSAVDFNSQNLTSVGTIGCGVLTSGNIIIPNAGNIGSVGDTDAIAISSGGAVTISAGQLTFPASQNASADANTLDDYEEGTWTPDLQFGGAKVDITYNVQAGLYTKIGRLVSLSADIELSSKGTSVGTARIYGLPFTVKNDNGAYSPALISIDNVSFADFAHAVCAIDNVYLHLLETTNAGTKTVLNNTNFADDSVFTICINYVI